MNVVDSLFDQIVIVIVNLYSASSGEAPQRRYEMTSAHGRLFVLPITGSRFFLGLNGLFEFFPRINWLESFTFWSILGVSYSIE